MERAKDVLSPLTQQRYHFVVQKLPDVGPLDSNPLIEALADNTRTPPDEQACFRPDFGAWLNTLGDRDRRIVEQLMVGERTLDVARKFGICPGRVSQLRREFHGRWLAFCAESPAQEGPPAPGVARSFRAHS
jgi:hypothetical protein